MHALGTFFGLYVAGRVSEHRVVQLMVNCGIGHFGPVVAVMVMDALLPNMLPCSKSWNVVNTMIKWKAMTCWQGNMIYISHTIYLYIYYVFANILILTHYIHIIIFKCADKRKMNIF